MKKYIIKISFLALLFFTITGCEKELAEKYNNPEKSSKADIPGFFTAMINNNRVRPAYWNVRTFLLLQPAIYSQTALFLNGNTAYQQNDGYTGQYWQDFYTPGSNGSGNLALYSMIEKTYNDMSEAEKAENQIFMQASRVLLYDQASQMVDLWGDIPFSEAGSLEKTSQISDPKFDDQKELYDTFLAGLKEAATYFNTATATPAFSKYDILLSGNLDRWKRYTNSLRLRLLMRISNIDEARAQAEIAEILGNAAQFPVVDGGNVGTYNPATTDILLQPLTTNTENLNSALTEISAHLAPDYMLNTVMLPSNDPRIPVMFDKFGQTVNGQFVPNAEYKAMPITFTQGQQESDFASYSILDSATFLQNPNLPGIVLTASEVNFLKAEAFERWGGGDAKAAYETAVQQSIAFYHYLNSRNTVIPPVAMPEPAVISTFLAQPTVAYTGTPQEKLAKVWTQKWLHFGFLQSTQAWSEYRRTNYPQLTFPTEGKLSGFEAPPTRLLYPSVETGYNSHYSEVQAENTRTTKIFWDVN